MEKIFSLSKRVWNALALRLKKIPSPSFTEMRYILRSFSFREKFCFLILILLMLSSLLGILWKIDRSLAIEIPKTGGTLNEGIVGTPRFINPLLSVSDVDRDLVSLIYSGLMRADEYGELMPDLADRYEISDDGLSYTFVLKEGLEWPDKKPITSEDIVFTIQMAKNSVLKSQQRASWEGVEIEKIDDRAIRFFLKRPYAPFLENATLGILPKHIWEKISPEQIALTDFNTMPLGSGPYQVKKIIKDSTGIIQSYILEPNKKFALGRPFIENLVLKFYPSEKNLVSAYEKGDIDSAGGISPQSALKIKKSSANLEKILLPRVFAVFFNQNNAPLFADKNVRLALNLATDKEKIVQEVLRDFGSTLNYPLPPGALGSLENPKDAVDQSEENLIEERIKEAKEILEKAGWKFNEEERIFKKTTKKETTNLEFSIATSNAPELIEAAEMLKIMWENLGAKVNTKIFEIGDLNQNVIRPRKYDALLFGMVMGRDPDPFAFWHSSQRNDPGLNIALYTNIAADKLLEEARTIFDTDKRKEKYEEFQKQVEKDVPAIFLYSPEYIYLVPNNLRGFNMNIITVPSERFSGIYKWYMETEKIWSRTK